MPDAEQSQRPINRLKIGTNYNTMERSNLRGPVLHEYQTTDNKDDQFSIEETTLYKVVVDRLSIEAVRGLRNPRQSLSIFNGRSISLLFQQRFEYKGEPPSLIDTLQCCRACSTCLEIDNSEWFWLLGCLNSGLQSLHHGGMQSIAPIFLQLIGR